MDRETLIQRIKEKKYTHEELLKWIPQLPSRVKPIYHKVGDVHFHPIFKHPLIILKKVKSGWLCGLLTTEVDCPEIIEPCQSRFFDNSFFTKVLFITPEIKGGYITVYDNPKHLKKVTTKLFEEFNGN